tara:strand:- start:5400 stop:5663 length:264 start_codon:yes stop_codon:yes gene_type:complete
MLYKLKVIEDTKLTFVEIEVESIYSVLQFLSNEKNISHLITITEVNSEGEDVKIWDFLGNIDLLRAIQINADLQEDLFKNVRERKIH